MTQNILLTSPQNVAKCVQYLYSYIQTASILRPRPDLYEERKSREMTHNKFYVALLTKLKTYLAFLSAKYLRFGPVFGKS